MTLRRTNFKPRQYVGLHQQHKGKCVSVIFTEYGDGCCGDRDEERRSGMKCKETQGRRIIGHLKMRAMTYREMLDLRISLAPWARVIESLAENERLMKTKNGKGLMLWRVRVER